MTNTIALQRPASLFDPRKGLLHNDHFQIGYVTNDIDRAVGVFRDRFGVSEFRGHDNDLPGGGWVSTRSVWIGAMMFELCSASGAGMEHFSERAPAGADFILTLHHFGYLVPDEETWAVLEQELARHGWKVRSNSNIPGFVRACMVEAPELGHFLEFILPREGQMSRFNQTPVA